MMQTEYAVVGTSPPRTGLADKIRGEAVFTADLKLPGMLYARVLRSPHAHARVVQVHTDAALQLPGVHAVITYRDVPQVRIDEDLLPLDSIVRYVGDEVAVVAAESDALAEDALRLIRVDYEEQAAVFEAEAALLSEAGFNPPPR